MAAEIQVKSLPAVFVLATHTTATVGTVKERMGEAFGALMRHVAATGVTIVGPPFTQYQEPVEGEFAFAVCMPVAPGAVAGEGVDVEQIPGCEAASLLYKGAYDGMEDSWRGLLAWVAEKGREPGGPLREVYLNDPGQVAESDLMTELLVPLA